MNGVEFRSNRGKVTQQLPHSFSQLSETINSLHAGSEESMAIINNILHRRAISLNSYTKNNIFLHEDNVSLNVKTSETSKKCVDQISDNTDKNNFKPPKVAKVRKFSLQGQSLQKSFLNKEALPVSNSSGSVENKKNSLHTDKLLKNLCKDKPRFTVNKGTAHLSTNAFLRDKKKLSSTIPTAEIPLSALTKCEISLGALKKCKTKK